MRASGNPQVSFAGESQVDIMADALAIDPVTLRLRNLFRDGDLLPNGRVMKNPLRREVLQEAVKASGWNRPKKRPDAGRGIAMSYRSVGTGDANARLTLPPDGTISLLTT